MQSKYRFSRPRPDRFERGLSLLVLVIWIAAAGAVGLTVMRAVPQWVEFAEIKRVIRGLVASGETDLPALRARFDLQAGVGGISSVTGADLEIDKADAGKMAIGVSYQTRVDLVGNTFLGFDFSTRNGE
jgi:hypothetical protein